MRLIKVEEQRATCPSCNGVSATNLGSHMYWCPNCEMHYVDHEAVLWEGTEPNSIGILTGFKESDNIK